jgi:DNA repair protein RecN (Recombination protein N)
MLASLYVKDFAIVSEVEVAFGPGMTVVSGETGAGKSLLVDALLLLTGARADAAAVRHGAERAELAAEFRLQPDSPALHWLREQEFDDDGECQLRRTIRADGGSRAWINGRPATLAQQSALGETLLEIHGQHEHQALLDRHQQLNLLDAFGRHETLREPVRERARRWHEIQQKIELMHRQGDVSERLAWLEHQADELSREALSPDEIATLLADHRRQSHAATLIEGCERALARLMQEDGLAVGAALRSVRNELTRVIEHEPRLSEVVSLLDAAQIQLDEAGSTLERLRDDLDLDPERLQSLDARLARLHDLGRKHRVPIEALAEHREAVLTELESLRDADANLQRVQDELLQAGKAWTAAAAKLSAARTESAGGLSQSVTALMGELGMGGGRFVVQVEATTTDRPDPNGAERIEFLVTANPGQPPRALRKVASGGELSRISLAIEVAALGLDAVQAMVFDEVDSGIGGGVAEVVGQKLRALGSQRQVLCVTHLPQVAAQGQHHLRVSKAAQGEDTFIRIERLDDAERIEELARMLGGIELTRETRAHARQMLKDGQSQRRAR